MKILLYQTPLIHINSEVESLSKTGIPGYVILFIQKHKVLAKLIVSVYPRGIMPVRQLFSNMLQQGNKPPSYIRTSS